MMKSQLQKTIWVAVFWIVTLPGFAQKLEPQLEPQLVKNINAGLSTKLDSKSTPQDPVIINKTLYFTASDVNTTTDIPTRGNELWKTKDDTVSTTMIVKDINPGPLSSNPSHLTEYQGQLYFVAETDGVGRELWKSDGTEKGTLMVKDIYPGTPSSNPRNFVVFNGLLYFTATNKIFGTELWRTDGSEEGTALIKDVVEGEESSFPTSLIISNNTLFFTTLNGNNNFPLWKSNGTELGTLLVVNRAMAFPSLLSSLIDVDGVLFFQAVSNSAYELWKSDGSEEGTDKVKALESPALSLKALNTMLVFVSKNGGNGYQLWISNGEVEGTVPIILNAADYTFLGNLTVVENRLFFTTDQGNNQGQNLWVFDGTVASLVKNIGENATSGLPAWLMGVNNELYFVAEKGGAWALWRSDGRAEGTQIIREVDSPIGQSNQWMRVVGGTTFYFTMLGDADDSEYQKLWKIETNASPNAVIDTVPVYQCAGNSTQVTLNGSQSSDFEDESLSLEWRGQFGLVVGEEVTVPLTAGERKVLLTAIDSRGHAHTTSTVVKIEDKVPPIVVLNKSVVVIAAESDKGANYNIEATVSDQCSGIGLYQLTSQPVIPFSIETSPSGLVATGVYPLGETVVELSVEDQSGNQALSVISIKVVKPEDLPTPLTSVAPGSNQNATIKGIAVTDNGGGAIHPMVFLFFIAYGLYVNGFRQRSWH
ncbi:MAG: hypothetical protein GXP14_08205 [Gammaproteobacteria bacterium]|nr:hypothetical protein [Gammaproteobacteria bacterium]